MKKLWQPPRGIIGRENTEIAAYISLIEKRYGPLPKQNVVERFGDNYVNGLCGWWFPKNVLISARLNNQILTLDMDDPGQICKLNCIYCFAKAGEKTGVDYRPTAGEARLTYEEIRNIVLAAKSKGLQSIKVIGYREPFESKEFLDFIDFCSKLNIRIVVFTSAYTIGEKFFKGDVDKAVNWLAERKVSLMIKHHTLDKKVEMGIVNADFPNYPDIRDTILKKLIEDGRFTNTMPTRLGLEMVLSNKNPAELKAIYETFKIGYGLYVDIDVPIPVGRTPDLKSTEEIGLKKKEYLQLCIDIHRINYEYGIPYEGPSPFFGGDMCNIMPIGLYTLLNREIRSCCGSNEVLEKIPVNVNDTGDYVMEVFDHRTDYWSEWMTGETHHHCPYRCKTKILSREDLEYIDKAVKKIYEG
ncbi:hypothetical protein KO465_00135 [Candidatus Micrarchaeota archaeon]|nr:hypothetical protein [Candidatus Micrarchaeota archaeon]